MLLGDVLSDDDEHTGLHSHDIGKLATPKEILHKTGRLTDDEWVIMREHTVVGERMLDRVGGYLRAVGTVVRSSHERVDGIGYPERPGRHAVRLGRRRGRAEGPHRMAPDPEAIASTTLTPRPA
jgi:hypothetical protein